MKLNHHYTLTITCDPPPPRTYVLGGDARELQVITLHGDYTTLHEALAVIDADGSPLSQLERFEQSLNADDPAGR